MFNQQTIMKQIILILGMTILCSLNLFAQDKFEGKVKFKVGDEDEKMIVNYFTRDEKVRMEMGKEIVMIFDSETIKMLMPAQGMYMEYPKNMAAMMEQNNTEDNEKDMEPNITGKTMDILGYECAQWLFESEDGEMEMWVTDELGTFFPMQSPMSGDAPEWQSNLADGNFFPMLVQAAEEGEDKQKVFEVLGVDKTTVSKDLFLVPKNLKKMDMPFQMK